MPDLFYLISKWWKQMVALVLLSLSVAAIVLFLQPVKYLSVATALPASAFAADKSSVFNNNIQQLYPAIGTTDDLDMIVGTGQLDTVYIAVAVAFNLGEHYKVEERGEAAILKGAYLLRVNTKVMKSEYGELKVRVWDRDKELAARFANAIMDKLRSIHQDLQNNNNINTLQALQSRSKKIALAIDSITVFLRNSDITPEKAAIYTARRAVLSEQLQQQEKLIGQYQLMLDNKPAALVVVEKARPASWPDKPRKFPVFAGTFILALLFSLLVAVLLEKRKK